MKRNRHVKVVIAFVSLWLSVSADGQTSSPYKPPRTPDGKPDLNGIWQTFSAANWDLEDHSARQGAIEDLGAIGAVPAGHGVVDGGVIPYRLEGLQKKKENFANRRTEDPEAKCYMPGTPRATYMPYAFQIIQTPAQILMAYEYATATRTINMGKPVEAASDTWMGTNNGRWEGDTLVIDVTGFNGLSWFDRAGNYASDKLHVVERFTRIGPDHMVYEATIEDPTVFTRPWKISLTLYRRVEKNAELLDFKCVEFSEDLLYGKFKKETK